MKTVSPNKKKENFYSVLTPQLSSHTHAFLDSYRQGIANSEPTDRIDALKRFKVKTITGNKSPDTTAQHELMSIAVLDSMYEDDYIFYLERTSSSSSVTTVTQVGANEVDLDAAEPLLTSGTSLNNSYPPLLPLPPSRTLSRQPSYRSIPDIISVGSARGLNSLMSLSKLSVAEDLFLGSAKFIENREVGLVCREIEPVGLSLYELAILADVIHEEAPTYNLMKNQCYWFLLTVFEVVLRVYENSLDTQAGVPPDQYLPKLSGTYAGCLIVAPIEEDLMRIENKFRERRREEFDMVCILIIFNNFYSTSLSIF
jgi:hypothetical protein